MDSVTDKRSIAPPRSGPDLTATWVGLATFANVIGWLGWHRPKYFGSDGYLHGPYQRWQIVGLVLALGLIAVVVGWRGRPRVAVVTITLVMTVSFFVQGATDPRSDGLFPVGSALVALGTYTFVAIVAGAANALRQWLARRKSTTSPKRPE